MALQDNTSLPFGWIRGFDGKLYYNPSLYLERNKQQPMTISPPKWDFGSSFGIAPIVGANTSNSNDKGNEGDGKKDGFNFGQAAAAFGASIPSSPMKIGGRTFQRGLWDAADPTYYLAGDRESAVGNMLSDTGVGLTKAGLASGNFGLALAGAIAKGVGSITNAAVGHSEDKEGKARLDNFVKQVGGLQFNNSSNEAILSQWSSAPMGGVIVDRKKYKNGWFNSSGDRAYEKAIALNNKAVGAATANATAAVNAARERDAYNVMGNFTAYGGPLDMFGSGAIGYEIANRYLASKERPTTDKLTLIPNGFGFGGSIHGGDFSNGIRIVDNGSSHEVNPFGGVPMGVDRKGTPNLVEEGEVIFNDYVFSNRIQVPNAIRQKYKLREGTTFADAAKFMQRESEERPNDPISKRGLNALMTELAYEQEMKKAESPQSMNGNRFDGGGPFNSYGYVKGYNGGWYDESGKYTQDYISRVNALTAAQLQAQFDDQYTFYTDPANKDTDRWKAIDNFYKANPAYNKAGYQVTQADLDAIKGVNGKKGLALDGKPGYMHYLVNEATKLPERKQASRYWLRSADPTKKPTLIEDYTDELVNGYTWAERHPTYKAAGSRVITEGDTDYTDYYFDDTTPAAATPAATTTPTAKNNFYVKGEDGKYTLVRGDNPYLQIQNMGKYTETSSKANTDGGTDYYYDPQEENPEYKRRPTFLRYAPAVGLGLATLTDSLGWTNKPDYSSADRLMESINASMGAPVRFKTVGNYLGYNQFDIFYNSNPLRAANSATRRSIEGVANGNAGQAMAGILTSDYNMGLQMGNLQRQAAEYNLAQRQAVEQFNRETNTINSKGLLDADIASKADREYKMKGILAAAEMMEQERLRAATAQSANASGFLTALGNIGRENQAYNWRNFGLATGSFGVIPKEVSLDAYGGRLKRIGL